MDHIAFVTKKDPIEIRKLNCNPKEKAVLDEMIQTILTSSNYTNRLQQVENYNKVKYHALNYQIEEKNI